MNKKGKNGLYVFISAIAINVISSMIYAKIAKIDIITAFKSIWNIILTFFIRFLSIEFRLWQILVFLIFIVIAIKIYIEVKSKVKVNDVRPDFMDFTTGVYKEIHYRWKIEKTYNNEIKMENFRPICSCGLELTTKNRYKNKYYSEPKLFCVNCDEIIEEKFDYELKEDAKLFFTNELNKKINLYNESIQSKNM